MTHSLAIKESLIALATITGKELNAIALNAFVEALSDLDQDEVLNALKSWLKTGRGFPFPVDIRSRVKPETNELDDAQWIASKAIAAVRTCGRTNPDRAREKLGELGWKVIEDMGGWEHFCTTLHTAEENTKRAQIREFALTIIKREKGGYGDTPPSLPSPTVSSAKLHNDRVNLLEDQADQIRKEDAQKLIQTTMKGIE